MGSVAILQGMDTKMQVQFLWKLSLGWIAGGLVDGIISVGRVENLSESSWENVSLVLGE